MATNRTKKPTRLTEALLETADDMRRAGVITAAAHEKITLRHLGDRAPSPDPITPDDMWLLREQAPASWQWRRSAASPATAARVRRASARQPGFAGFALAPVRRDAAGGGGLPKK